MNIFDKMNSLQSFTHNEEALMSFIMREPHRFIELKPKQIAKEAYVSLSTIYRFADKLELDGINALKVELITALMETEPETVHYDLDSISSQGSPLQYLGQLKDISVQTLNKTFLKADPGQLHMMMDLLKDSNHMVVFSNYANIWFANNFQYQMQEIGRVVQVPIDQYSQVNLAGRMREDDISIVVSINGRSKVMQKVTEVLRKNKSPFILITANKDNPMVPMASSVFWLEPLESGFDELAEFTIRSSVLFAFDSLYTMYFKSHFSEHRKIRTGFHSNTHLLHEQEELD